MNATTSPTGSTLEQVQSLLWREADCADEHRFDDWFALWDDKEDLLYWAPAGGDDVDPTRAISIVYDNRSRMDNRLFRLKGRFAHAQRPQSRMRRIVSNIVVDSDDGQHVEVHANFIFAETRNGQQDVFNGRFVYRLRRRENGLRIVSKKVLLVNNGDFVDNLTFLL